MIAARRRLLGLLERCHDLEPAELRDLWVAAKGSDREVKQTVQRLDAAVELQLVEWADARGGCADRPGLRDQAEFAVILWHERRVSWLTPAAGTEDGAVLVSGQ